MNKKLNINSILFNLAGVGMIVIAGGYAIGSLFHREVSSACFSRYASSHVMSITTPSGRPMNPVQLSTSLDRTQWGVDRNVLVKNADHTPVANTLQVSLRKGASNPYQNSEPKSGVAFSWAPHDFAPVESACLRYRVQFPKDFDFGRGGFLPGFYGGKLWRPDRRADGITAFSSRLLWREEGRVVIFAQTADTLEGGPGRLYHPSRLFFEKDKWTDIQQEIVLNDPKKSNGQFRLWIDGKLEYEVKNLRWRDTDKIAVGGVAGDLAFGWPQRAWTSPKDQTVSLSPFEFGGKNRDE